MEYPFSEYIEEQAKKSWAEVSDSKMSESFLVGYFYSAFNNLAEKMKEAAPEAFAEYEKTYMGGK